VFATVPKLIADLIARLRCKDRDRSANSEKRLLYDPVIESYTPLKGGIRVRLRSEGGLATSELDC
jgi:hypothetical protein